MELAFLFLTISLRLLVFLKILVQFHLLPYFLRFLLASCFPQLTKYKCLVKNSNNSIMQ
jgi:hypothetical protein